MALGTPGPTDPNPQPPLSATAGGSVATRIVEPVALKAIWPVSVPGVAAWKLIVIVCTWAVAAWRTTFSTARAAAVQARCTCVSGEGGEPGEVAEAAEAANAPIDPATTSAIDAARR